MNREALTREQKEERALDAIIACLLRDDLPENFWQKIFEKMDARETETVAAPSGSQPDSVAHQRLVRSQPLPMPDGIITRNASHEPCDMADGPCCCGAWHHLDDWPEPIRQALASVTQ